MLPKVAHYAGFQSYADLPYASLKPGRRDLENNTVYQQTVRDGDSLQFYDNNNRYNTVYDRELSKTVGPHHYHDIKHVTKQQVERPLFATGKMTLAGDSVHRRAVSTAPLKDQSGLNPKGLALMHQTLTKIKREPHDELAHEQHTKRATTSLQWERPVQDDDYNYAENGTEHWKSTYMAGIKDPYAYAKATRPEWSLHRPPHTVREGPMASDYKISFGQRGDNPVDKLFNTAGVKVSDESLKLGSTQGTKHIPGYTGHMPKSVIHPDRWSHSLGLDTRETIVKQNIVENYQTRIPGYQGHRPRNAVNDRGNLREQCFSTSGETYC